MKKVVSDPSGHDMQIRCFRLFAAYSAAYAALVARGLLALKTEHFRQKKPPRVENHRLNFFVPGKFYSLIHNIYPPYFAFFTCVRCIFNVYWKALDNIMESCQSGRSCSTRNAVSLTGPRVRIPDSPPKTLKEFTWGFFFSFICLSYSSDMKPASKLPYETAAKGDNEHQQHHYRQYFHENKRRSALSDRWTYPYRCPYHGKSNQQ